MRLQASGGRRGSRSPAHLAGEGAGWISGLALHTTLVRVLPPHAIGPAPGNHATCLQYDLMWKAVMQAEAVTRGGVSTSESGGLVSRMNQKIPGSVQQGSKPLLGGFHGQINTKRPDQYTGFAG
jgi:hypothetical protein